MGVQGIEYGRGHERLEKLLRSIDRPGNYCTGGREFLALPRVVVEGVGELSFPVPPVQVEALADAAERAPYGKGTRTLVDPSVRDCWQIDARDVSLSGRAWPGSLAKIMELAAEGLGLPAERLGAELYKLLVYRRGGFFAEHRDTEKVPGMVATLSLSLPAAGAGGEIVVRHGDDETTYDMTTDEPSELAFAAFYADCPHEVLPVTEGHRVSLVFNLFLGSAGRGPGAPDYSNLLAPVAECLAEWRAESVEQDSEEQDSEETGDKDANKIVWLLEHEYSEDGLSFATLKNTDAAVAGVLQEAAARAGCEFLAAVLRIHEYGTPDFHMDYWDNVEEDDSTMVDVHDRWEALDSWAATDGSRPKLGEIPLNEGELLPEGALDDAEPDDRHLEGSTGNEGPTLEHVYRRAALVVWPHEKAVDVLVRGGIDGAVAWAASRITGNGDADSERDVEVIERLLELWPLGEPDYRQRRLRPRPGTRDREERQPLHPGLHEDPRRPPAPAPRVCGGPRMDGLAARLRASGEGRRRCRGDGGSSGESGGDGNGRRLSRHACNRTVLRGGRRPPARTRTRSEACREVRGRRRPVKGGHLGSRHYSSTFRSSTPTWFSRSSTSAMAVSRSMTSVSSSIPW